MLKHLNINRGTIFLRKIKIYGKVQGVIFRYSTKLKADNLGIKGFAKNEDDGTVYIEAEGEEENLNKFVNWCKNGPPLAKIEGIEVTEEGLKNFPKFSTH